MAGESVLLSNIGDIFESQGLYEDALQSYQDALVAVESVRNTMSVDELKSYFVAEKEDIYERVIALHAKLDQANEAFNMVQRAKARTFLDQMANVHIDPRTTDNPELITSEQELAAEIRAMEDILFGRRSPTTFSVDASDRDPSLLSKAQRDEMQTRLEDAYREYQQLLTQLKLSNPQYADLRSVQVSNLDEIQQGLPAGVSLIEYYMVSTQTLAFVVTQDDFYMETLPLSEETLFHSLRTFYDFPDINSSSPPESMKTLYNLLIAPLEPHLKTQQLIIAPHFGLHYVPFAALSDGKDYLVDHYTLVQLPSASFLPLLPAGRPVAATRSALVFGNADGTLPDAQREAEIVAGLYGITAYLGSEALEQHLWRLGSTTNVLHLATHGIYNPKIPLFSYILLAPDEKGEYDGRLETREVYNLDLQQTDLVVLSACQTNLGEHSRGDEIIGLNRAFLYAGASSVIASLWAVEDESTSLLMERFYTHLKDGMGKAEALREAQIEVREQYPNPYYWAAFVLSGSGG